MNSCARTQLSQQMGLVLIALCLIGAPAITHAETPRPTCALTVETSAGSQLVKNKADVLLIKGDEIQITWKSKNATAGTNRKGESIKLSGTTVRSPDKTTTYSYHFSKGNAKTVCFVTVHVVTGGFASSSLQSLSSKPTIKGIASGMKAVHIKVFKAGSTTTLFTSKSIPVKNGMWKTKLTQKLPKGTYDIVLLGEKRMTLNVISRETLTIGKISQKVEKTTGSIAVLPVPLLTGGIARAGASVALSYLQVINVGTEPITLHGFTVKQNGSASTDSIAQLTISDDSGGFRNSVGGSILPFKNGTAFIPLEVPLIAGQTRLFTIKAILPNNITPYLGTQLKVDITGVDASANIKSTFPIRGTTWTFGI